MKSKKSTALFLLLGLLVIALAFIPDLVSEELKPWCQEQFGPQYPGYFIGFFVIASFILLPFTIDFKALLGSSSRAIRTEQLNIPWSLEAKNRLQAAKKAIADAHPQTALKLLYAFDSPHLNEPLTLLSSRLVHYQQGNHAGIQTSEEKDVHFNRINKDILSLINTLEASFSEKEAQNREIRASLRARYQERLKQKMAHRQPVKLRKWTSKEGTSELVASTFQTYPTGEIPEEIGQIFQDAHGRLLMIGAPGMGKTTLLLQLADRLFDLESDTLPVLVNLASWQSSFIKLETWLEEVLASELSTNKSGAKAVLQQSNLILLLDGLDELKEASEMASCLAAIAEYGKTTGRRFVITCRVEEYKAVQEDARVNMQIEVGALDANELIAELDKIGYSEPEAKILAQALRKDDLLRQVVETPFYFNTLQLLYAVHTPTFSTQNLEARKSEIVQQFITYVIKNTQSIEYSAANMEHWLSFLAKRMNDKSKVVFELLDLQYDWQKGTKGEKIIAGLFFGLVFGLVFGLAGGIIGVVPGGMVAGMAGRLTVVLAVEGLVLGLVLGIAGGLVLGLALVLEDRWPRIETKDKILWSLDFFCKYILKKLDVLLLWGLLYGSIYGLLCGFMAGVVLGLLIILVGGLALMLMEKSMHFTQINKPYQRFQASMRQLHFSILQHGHLRYLLYKKGLLPWRLVEFLNEMKARDLMESNGATWRFRHRIIQEYFAEKWVEDEAE